MRAWHKRVVIDTVKTLIPGKQHLRQVFRRISPYQTDHGTDGNLFDNIVKQIEMLREAGFDVTGKRILEIGSGWHPIAAMTFLAAGAETVTLTDIERLLDPHLIRSAINFVSARRQTLVDRLGIADLARLDIEDGSIAQMIESLGLTYLVPYRTGLSSDASADLIVSCSVFEHIPAVILESMMAEFRRILVPGGAMVHFIDCSDHYWQADSSISRCNFLQYEEWLWRLLSLNPQNFHNRLRHSDFAAIFLRHGFKVVSERRLSREQEQREVSSMKLASRFAGREIADLAAITANFVLVSP